MVRVKRITSDNTAILAKKWAEKNHVKNPDVPLKYWSTTSRRRFEDWLWSNGVRLLREDKKYYLEFLEESTASFFLLKYL